MKETLGQYLKREREARSISLDELSKGTRINRAFLEALEKDDLNFFAQRDFIVGFLKGYTRYLGLTPDEALKRFLRQVELESRKIDFRQLALFPNFAGDKKEDELLNQKSSIKKTKSSKWLYLQIVITLVALSASIYLQQILKEADLPSQRTKNEISPSTTSPTLGTKGLDREQGKKRDYSLEKNNSEGKDGLVDGYKSANVRD